jgi:RNA polymerase sigma-70 factor, ECF subfamily
VTDEGRDLLERARGGDLDAFEEFVRLFERRVGRVLARLLDDDRDVAEAVQDTFVKAWRNLGGFRGDAAPFTWLYRVAVNEALQRKRTKRLQTQELTEADLVAPGIDTGDLRGFLERTIRALPIDLRAAVVLRDVEGFSNEEVADLLEISVPAAKSRIHRGRLQVRAAFEAWESST